MPYEKIVPSLLGVFYSFKGKTPLILLEDEKVGLSVEYRFKQETKTKIVTCNVFLNEDGEECIIYGCENGDIYIYEASYKEKPLIINSSSKTNLSIEQIVVIEKGVLLCLYSDSTLSLVYPSNKEMKKLNNLSGRIKDIQYLNNNNVAFLVSDEINIYKIRFASDENGFLHYVRTLEIENSKICSLSVLNKQKLIFTTKGGKVFYWSIHTDELKLIRETKKNSWVQKLNEKMVVVSSDKDPKNSKLSFSNEIYPWF